MEENSIIDIGEAFVIPKGIFDSLGIAQLAQQNGISIVADPGAEGGMPPEQQMQGGMPPQGGMQGGMMPPPEMASKGLNLKGYTC